MEVETLAVGPFDTNCHIIHGSGKGALVVDPGWDADVISGTIRDLGLQVAAYLVTHGHMDHIGALADMHEMFPAPIAMHSVEIPHAFSIWNQMPPFYPVPRRPAEIARVLEDAQEWTDAGLEYRVIHTPGHSPGGVCFYFETEKALVSGDTLFAGSVGRVDFKGGNSRELARSLSLLSRLPDQVTVYPGHGPATELGHEKKTNPFLERLR